MVKSLSIQFILIFLCFAELLKTDAYYTPYLLILCISVLCTFVNHKSGTFFKVKEKKDDAWIITTFSLLFMLMITLSNYNIWLQVDVPEYFSDIGRIVYKSTLLAAISIGSFIAFRNIFIWIKNNIGIIIWKKKENNKNPALVFIIPFAIISLINLSILFLSKYPGVLNSDSLSQVKQLMTNKYSNHHPVFHTFLIKVFVSIGLRVFGEINAAVALYCVFQILFTAVCFSLMISTMYRIGVPRIFLILSILFYSALPMHIMYSFTVWKDVIFALFVLLNILFLFRCLKKIGNQIFNYFTLFISCMGVCLFRSNGFFAFVLTAACFLVLWKFKEKAISAIMIFSIILSFGMKTVLLDYMKIPSADVIESLSIPAQQISRVIINCDDFTDEEMSLLTQIVDVDKVPKIYLSWLSDPIKNLVRACGNQDLIAQNKWQYAKLYISVGLRHPVWYMKAWIDQTKGYWNSGYSLYKWTEAVFDNDMGLTRTTVSEQTNNIVEGYMWSFDTLNGVQPFMSIGFYIWINLLMLAISIFRRDKTGAISTVLITAIVASLLIATPVYAELRYIYAVFCALPSIILIVLRPIEKKE